MGQREIEVHSRSLMGLIGKFLRARRSGIPQGETPPWSERHWVPSSLLDSSMSTPPLLIALADQDALRSISQEFASRGRAHHVTTDGAQLLEAIQGATDIIVDPRVAPGGLAPEKFVEELLVKAQGGRLLALSDGVLGEDTLLLLGVTDVIGLGTSPMVVAKRLENTPIVADGATPSDDATETEDVGDGRAISLMQKDGSKESPSSVDQEKAIADFTERVSTRLTRARDREKAVALLAVSVRGFKSLDPRRELRDLIETVLEDLDQSQVVSYSASRMLLTALGDDIFGVLVPDVERVQDAARLGVKLHETMSTIEGVMTHVGIARM